MHPNPSPTPIREALVVGGGVSGLSCGIRLLEAGIPATLVTAALSTDDHADAPKPQGAWPPGPASPWAAAVWYPYRAEPRARVARWSVGTLHALRALYGEPDAGVWEVELMELRDHAMEDEEWHASVGAERVREGLPARAVEAFRMRVPFMDVPVYLRWLVRRFEALGGRIARRVVADLAAEAEAVAGWVVVNCTGLGARRLCGDEAVYPCRGQLVRVERPPEPVQRVLETADGTLTYVFSRGADCVLGGTAEDGVWAERAEDDEVEAIRARAAALVPGIERMRVLASGAGLRPVRRGSVRVEAERTAGGGLVVHDYGHGGAGYTLSWGCADEVVRLATEGSPGESAGTA